MSTNNSSNNRNLVATILFVGIAILLGLTNPPDEKHYSEIRKIIMAGINDKLDYDSDNEWELLGQGLGLALGGKMIDTFISSYVEVNNYVFFSVTKVSDKVIGYGLLNNVWIFNEVRSAFADKKPRKKTNTSDYGQQATDIINSINRVYATNKSDTKYKPKDVTRKPLKTFDVSKSKRMENYEKLKDLNRVEDITRVGKVDSMVVKANGKTTFYKYYSSFTPTFGSIYKGKWVTAYQITREDRIFAKVGENYGYLRYMRLDIPEWFAVQGKQQE